MTSLPLFDKVTPSGRHDPVVAYIDGGARGNHKVKSPGLQPLHGRAGQLARQVGRVSFEHVGRSSNAHADGLANAAMDGART